MNSEAAANSGTFDTLDVNHVTPDDKRSWLIIAAGLAALFLPTYFALSKTVWTSDEQGHGPIILGVILWLAWQRRQAFFMLADHPERVAGTLFLATGLMFYIIGRSQSIDTVEVSAHILILASVLLLTKGWKGLKWGGFLLFFLMFIIPLPGIFVQAITTPLKISVSHVAEAVLHGVGYPVARNGVILYIGNYQLLVADACAGLNSMFTLEALGLLYMNIMNYTSIKRNALLAFFIIPIAFLANVVRVIVLVLVTFYFGDEAGQGFMHAFAGMILFMVALGLILVVDPLIGRAVAKSHRTQMAGS